jgi:hypothetical protein
VSGLLDATASLVRLFGELQDEEAFRTFFLHDFFGQRARELAFALEKMTLPAIERWQREGWPLPGRFYGTFGRTYSDLYCLNDDFSPSGEVGLAIDAWASRLEGELSELDERIADVERLLDVDLQASPAWEYGAREALELARETTQTVRDRANETLASWRETVAEASAIRERVTEAYVATVERFARAGVDVGNPECVEWGFEDGDF